MAAIYQDGGRPEHRNPITSITCNLMDRCEWFLNQVMCFIAWWNQVFIPKCLRSLFRLFHVLYNKCLHNKSKDRHYSTQLLSTMSDLH